MLRFKWMRFRRGFAANRSGATAIEYALIAVFIAISIVVAAPAIGVSVNALYLLVTGAL
jgi:pilus assembly protein Flp/PilA